MNSASLCNLPLNELLLRRRALRREFLAIPELSDIRIAVLGGTTTSEFVELAEILLLGSGFRPTFYQSEYGRFYEDAVFEPETISQFKPDIVYIHTCSLNIKAFPPVSCSESEFSAFVNTEIDRYRTVWTSLGEAVGCQIVQNNFELPTHAVLGNLDTVSPGGASRFICELNRQFALEAASNPRLTVQDLFSISARTGIRNWFDPERWFSYKIANTIEGSFEIARSLAALVRGVYGRSRKVLVLDLDNTLWGGVIGDDGPDNIVIGRETPIAEAFTAFQEYCLALRACGVLLAACSKNNEDTAKLGFSHPDSVLKLEHFSAFKANWNPKDENILAIAHELSLGVESFVFIDDNPVERALVQAQLPAVAVPDVGNDVTQFASIIESQRYFEKVSLVEEDLVRAKLYEQNAKRADLASQFSNYGEYLDSLEMVAEIDAFNGVYLDRITQLTNKSNQFNLTTRRYTLAEIEDAAKDEDKLGIYGRLADRFGDNGLISVVLGRIEETDLHIDLWLMSCRVLKREMEIAMLDTLVERAKQRRIERILGYYIPTTKNSMVADHYEKLGFTLLSERDGSSDWSLEILEYKPRSLHIRILERMNG